MAAPGSRQVITQRSGLPSRLETHWETSASRTDARSLERAGWLLTIRTKGMAEDLPIDSRNQSTSSSAACSAADGERGRPLASERYSCGTPLCVAQILSVYMAISVPSSPLRISDRAHPSPRSSERSIREGSPKRAGFNHDFRLPSLPTPPGHAFSN